ncbi:MAG: hypothetical protein NZ561_09180, partial [Phycisphaerae bacterium]|nr:hypothetical protein [Phycisphaerae bacterium]
MLPWCRAVVDQIPASGVAADGVSRRIRSAPLAKASPASAAPAVAADCTSPGLTLHETSTIFRPSREMTLPCSVSRSASTFAKAPTG